MAMSVNRTNTVRHSLSPLNYTVVKGPQISVDATFHRLNLLDVYLTRPKIVGPTFGDLHFLRQCLHKFLPPAVFIRLSRADFLLYHELFSELHMLQHNVPRHLTIANSQGFQYTKLVLSPPRPQFTVRRLKQASADGNLRQCVSHELDYET